MHYIVMFLLPYTIMSTHNFMFIIDISSVYIVQPAIFGGRKSIWWTILTAFPLRKSAVTVLIWFLVKLTFINLSGYSPPVYQQLSSRIFFHYVFSLISSKITWMLQLGIPNVDHEKQNEVNLVCGYHRKMYHQLHRTRLKQNSAINQNDLVKEITPV